MTPDAIRISFFGERNDSNDPMGLNPAPAHHQVLDISTARNEGQFSDAYCPLGDAFGSFIRNITFTHVPSSQTEPERVLIDLETSVGHFIVRCVSGHAPGRDRGFRIRTSVVDTSQGRSFEFTNAPVGDAGNPVSLPDASGTCPVCGVKFDDLWWHQKEEKHFVENKQEYPKMEEGLEGWRWVSPTVQSVWQSVQNISNTPTTSQEAFNQINAAWVEQVLNVPRQNTARQEATEQPQPEQYGGTRP